MSTRFQVTLGILGLVAIVLVPVIFAIPVKAGGYQCQSWSQNGIVHTRCY